MSIEVLFCVFTIVLFCSAAPQPVFGEVPAPSVAKPSDSSPFSLFSLAPNGAHKGGGSMPSAPQPTPLHRALSPLLPPDLPKTAAEPPFVAKTICYPEGEDLQNCLNEADLPEECQSCHDIAIDYLWFEECMGFTTCLEYELEICVNIDGAFDCGCTPCLGKFEIYYGCMLGVDDPLSAMMIYCDNNPLNCMIPTPAPTAQPTPAPTVAPTPSPPSPPPGFDCFSGINSVQVQGKGTIPISQLQIGDYIYDGRGYTRVYSLGHDDPKSVVKYFQIYVDDLPDPLEVSSWHILVVNGRMDLASNVRVGDVLGGHKVVVIGSVERQGKYGPLTISGFIQVNQIVASNHPAFLSISPTIQHIVARVFLAPVRWSCWIDFSICQSEAYTNGTSNWGRFGLAFLSRIQNYDTFLQIAAIIVAFPFICALTYPSLAFLAAGSLLLYAKKKTELGKKIQ